jgi:hypothetical protein
VVFGQADPAPTDANTIMDMDTDINTDIINNLIINKFGLVLATKMPHGQI